MPQKPPVSQQAFQRRITLIMLGLVFGIGALASLAPTLPQPSMGTQLIFLPHRAPTDTITGYQKQGHTLVPSCQISPAVLAKGGTLMVIGQTPLSTPQGMVPIFEMSWTGSAPTDSSPCLQQRFFLLYPEILWLEHFASRVQ